MSFRAGQTFLYPINDEKQIAHLWVIATDPNIEGLFPIASFTSLKGAKDQTVVLLAKEHPFIKWDTCVCYALAEITSSEKIQSYIDSGRAKMHRDIANRELLDEILVGFVASDFTKKRIREFVAVYRHEVKAKEAAE